MKNLKNNIFAVLFVAAAVSSCSRSSGDSPGSGTTPTPTPTPTVQNDADLWLTKGDESVKLQKQSTVISFSSPVNSYKFVDIDANQIFQTVDGFGYTLTGGSVEVINRLSDAKKTELLQDLFGSGTTSIGVSYLRLSIGASDLNGSVFSYDDLASGETDANLAKFSMDKDQPVIDMLKKILAINPNIKIIATPWSAPTWMKDNNSSIGGSLLPQYYNVYAQYFVKYIQTMKQNGIAITAVTPQNEPLHGGNNPSMVMTAQQQIDFIKNNLGPAFSAAGITTKIIVYDHNLDRPDYPTTVLSDSDASKYIDGTAFHLYGGDISTMSSIHNTFPSKNLYFTEQWTSASGDFGGDLKWHVKNVVIGSMRNWSKNALEWNVANDPSYLPHTQGGCDACKGAITVSGSDTYTKNVSYYIIAHASKFVPAGSVRIQSTQVGNLTDVAFQLPNGKIVLIVENDGATPELFNIRINGKWAATSLDGGSVATYIF